MTYNLIYMAKPIYGGWVTFTSHLSLKTNSSIFKVSKRDETRYRDFGYGTNYQNKSIDIIKTLPNLYITAIDKHYYQYLSLFPKGTYLVIHDPTELKDKTNPLIHGLLEHFNIITIRPTVYKWLKLNYNIQSTLIHHPFYRYPKESYPSMNNFAVSISRIDFDKNTDILLQYNNKVSIDKTIKIFGAENRLYVYLKLKDLNFHKYWYGKYPKSLPLLYNDLDILKNCQFMIDLSVIKQDGGGTQYTFLEAIYNDCILILHKEWINKGDLFINNYNCLAVSNYHELYDILTHKLPFNRAEIINNAKKILLNH